MVLCAEENHNLGNIVKSGRSRQWVSILMRFSNLKLSPKEQNKLKQIMIYSIFDNDNDCIMICVFVLFCVFCIFSWVFSLATGAFFLLPFWECTHLWINKYIWQIGVLKLGLYVRSWQHCIRVSNVGFLTQDSTIISSYVPLGVDYLVKMFFEFRDRSGW